MADKIRVGIVGATVTQGGSGWGANAHVPALKALPDYELVAVCTAHEDTAKASAEAFGVSKAYHSMDDMVADPDIDLVVVSVRVPGHYDLVMKSLRAGKNTFCEWPLGANLKEADEMAGLANEKGLRTIVGLQGCSDPHVMYAKELVQQGSVGEVLAASVSIVGGAQLERGSGRVWQRSNGANTLTISGGHGIDAFCNIVGEFAEVSGRVSTRVTTWRNIDTNEDVKVDSPDCINVAGALENGAEAAIQVLSLPHAGGGTRIEVYGREGVLSLAVGGAASIGPNRLVLTKGREQTELEVPDRFKLVPEGTPSGSPRNVAQAYTRLADSFQDGDGFDPDFDHAVKRHRLIDAIERSSAEAKAVRL
jgi:predicted dehydrogenase